MLIIDVRESLEYKLGHVNDALNIPVTKLMRGLPAELEDVDKDEEIVVYCHSGSRSAAAIQMLGKYGFTNLVNGINKSTVQAKYL